jgi:ABC-type transport system involved in cytochrome c biogenesis permease subunit
MTPSILQGVLMPLSFGSLFSLMLLYWGQAALFSYTKYSKLTTVLLSFSFVSLTALLLLRWIDSGHFPLSNLYESLLFLSWSFLGIQLVAQQAIPLLEVFLIVPIPIVAEPARRVFISPQQQLLHLLGVIISPMALLTYGFAFLNLPREMQKATALVPALQSNWLMMHVTIMILSYAALLCGSIFSMVFLLLTSLNPSPPKSSVQTASKPDHAHYTQVTEAAPSLAKRSLNTLKTKFREWVHFSNLLSLRVVNFSKSKTKSKRKKPHIYL